MMSPSKERHLARLFFRYRSTLGLMGQSVFALVAGESAFARLALCFLLNINSNVFLGYAPLPLAGRNFEVARYSGGLAGPAPALMTSISPSFFNIQTALLNSDGDPTSLGYFLARYAKTLAVVNRCGDCAIPSRVAASLVSRYDSMILSATGLFCDGP